MEKSVHVDRFFRFNPEWDNEKNRAVAWAVNDKIDQFAHYPDMEFLRRHRKFLHHAEGIEYFERRYGELGKLVATQHVIEDCEHVPNAIDYYIGTVNEFGHSAA